MGEPTLSGTVRALQAQVERLERRLAAGGPGVETALRWRGWRLGTHSRPDRVLLPRPAAPDVIDRYYADLKRYHFRRLLQEAAALRIVPPSAVRRLEERWGAAVARTFERLIGYGLLASRRGRYVLTAGAAQRFGDTLEWFVAQVFTREFLAPAAWDVRIPEMPAGGDFDVVALLGNRLGYVECKASPPYNVSADTLEQFLGRVGRLAPEFAVLVIDTTLRIDRNILDNLVRLLAASGARASVDRAAEGVWEVRGGLPLYVVTSRRSLVANLGRTLRLLFATRAGA